MHWFILMVCRNSVYRAGCTCRSSKWSSYPRRRKWVLKLWFISYTVVYWSSMLSYSQICILKAAKWTCQTIDVVDMSKWPVTCVKELIITLHSPVEWYYSSDLLDSRLSSSQSDCYHLGDACRHFENLIDYKGHSDWQVSNHSWR